MTMAIVVVGAAIFCIWVIIPIREYRSIYLRLRKRRTESGERSEPLTGPGFPVIPPTDGQTENRR